MFKKILSAALAALMLLTPVSAEAALTSTNLPTFTGPKNTDNAAATLQFQDIAGHWAQKSILRMCAVSLMHGESRNTFAPQKYVTYAEALVCAVRLKGLEVTAQAESELLAGVMSYPIASTAEAKWLEGYLNVALENEILLQPEYDIISALSTEATTAVSEEINTLIDNALTLGNLSASLATPARQEATAALRQNRAWNAPVSRQLALAWIVRASGVTPVYGANQQNIYKLQDWQNMNPDQLPLVEAALQAGIISGASGGYFNPGAAITRGELASTLDRAFPYTADILGYQVQTGVIEQMEYLYTSPTMRSGFNQDVGLRLRNLDGTHVQIFATATHSGAGITSGSFPLYRYTSLISPTDLFQGGEVEYITSGETVVWMESR